ncbi:dihydrofolate reductase family protein [Pedococcus dokdonensis]|nr:dihydrofolate reductase family protein [Pedococcus dokdonensis]
MSTSIDGFVTDREGGFDWAAPDDELFRFHHDEVATLGAYLLGRRLYETMLVWENDPTVRETDDGAEFADIWTALPKVVFSRTLDAVQGNARLARGSVAAEVTRALEATDRAVSIGGAELAGQAIELGLVDELRVYRCPVIAGGGTPHLPAVAQVQRFELVETRRFAQVVYERYRQAPAD